MTGLDLRGRVIAAARRLGITSKLVPHPSVALGASEVTLLELVACYAAIASDVVISEDAQEIAMIKRCALLTALLPLVTDAMYANHADSAVVREQG